MAKAEWNVTQAAKMLGLSRDALRYRMEKYSSVALAEWIVANSTK